MPFFVGWAVLCWWVGTAAKVAGLEKYRSPEGQKYDEANTERAREYIVDTFTGKWHS